jgi:hypothetical protein
MDRLEWIGLIVCVAASVGALAIAGVRRNRFGLAIGGVFAAFVATMGTTEWLFPETFQRWMQEDGWEEWATAFAWATAGAVAARCVLSRPIPIATRAALAGVALLCLFAAGEEISWGQRLFGLRPPDLLLEYNNQQELNLHNLVKSTILIALVAAGWALVLPSIARIWSGRGIGRAAAAASPPGWLALWASWVIWLAVTRPFPFAGEVAELLLAQLFLIGVGERARAQGLLASWKPVAACMGASLGLGVVTPPAVDALLAPSDPDRAARVRRELEILGMNLPSAVSPRLLSRSRVHKRLFTAVHDGYLRFEGAGSLFFLDPWQNPYWIEYAREEGGAWLYSFGPNRRRDSADQNRMRLQGDDIGLFVPLQVR